VKVVMEKSRDLARLWLKIEGRVQGVYFRASAVSEAQRLGLKGWVRNSPDGSVEVVAEGELGMLKELETWCRRGPAGARVERVNSRWEDVTNQFTDFRIRR